MNTKLCLSAQKLNNYLAEMTVTLQEYESWVLRKSD